MNKKHFYGALPLGILALVFPACIALMWGITFANINDTFENWMIIIMAIVTMAAMLFWFWLEFAALMRIEIDEKGVRRSLFKRLFKRYMSWEEVYEIRVIGAGPAIWLYFSKKSLAGVTHNKAPWMRGLIRVFYSEELHACILRHTDKPVINAPISDSKIRAKFNIPAEKRDETHTSENTKSND